MEYMGLKITQISPGLISIPPNGWGAIEKIIWNYKLNLEKLGNEVEIKYINQVTNEDGLVHVHVANQALELHDKGIPYIFSLHDHHVIHYGRGSYNYNINLEAIKHSVISITHAEFLVNHFDDTDKLFYLPHGVDTEFFTSDNRKKTEHKLLCLANNGMAGDSSIDRKGFLFAIDVAKQLNLPITIAGPTDNLEFFKHYPEYLKYEKLTLRCDSPTEDEILELYRNHTIFLHPSMLEAGHPNLTLLEALSCGLPVVGTYNGTKDIDGLVRVQRDVDSLVNGVIEVSENYNDIVSTIDKTRKEYSWKNIVDRLNKIYHSVKSINKEFSNEEAKQAYINAYESTKIEYKEPNEYLEFINHYVDGPFLEIKGNTNKKYKVQFLDEQDVTHYESMIGCNMWIRLNRKYYTKWTCKVYDGDKLVYSNTLNLEGQRVLIGLDSKSLGDTIAWFPYIDEFRKKHKCKVIASTFWNNFFKDQYPEMEFIEPGGIAHNLVAKYDIGWYMENGNYDSHRNPIDPNTQSLQKTASDILGLEFKEIKPKIKLFDNVQKEKIVTIGIHSTAQAKYWNNETGWQEITDYFKSQGYRVVLLSKENDGFMGNKHPQGIEKLPSGPIENVIEMLQKSTLFIGVSSGLSWLAWACNTPTCLISGFTEPELEFDCIRIYPKENVCRGCYKYHTFDAGDWNWCPVNKGTDKQFECSKSITANDVIEKVKHLVVS